MDPNFNKELLDDVEDLKRMLGGTDEIIEDSVIKGLKDKFSDWLLNTKKLASGTRNQKISAINALNSKWWELIAKDKDFDWWERPFQIFNVYSLEEIKQMLKDYHMSIINSKGFEVGQGYDPNNFVNSVKLYKEFFDSTDSTLDDKTSTEIIDETKRIQGAINKIFYGAPGTGKSYAVNKIYGSGADGIAGKEFKRVTFHPEYTYFDFIGGLKPQQSFNKETGEKEISYEFVSGPFTDALINAISNPGKEVGLIIEEINRANTASVFGDIFQLLDRDLYGASEYTIKNSDVLDYIQKQEPFFLGDEIKIPSNFSLIATMNSSDQGVYVMDSAFKRRWQFEYMPIDFDKAITKDVKIAGFEVRWKDFAELLNQALSNLGVEEDRLIGPYFLKEHELKNKSTVSSKLLIYLWDDVVRYKRDSLFNKSSQFAEIVKAFNMGRPIFESRLHEKLTVLRGENGKLVTEAQVDYGDNYEVLSKSGEIPLVAENDAVNEYGLASDE